MSSDNEVEICGECCHKGHGNLVVFRHVEVLSVNLYDVGSLFCQNCCTLEECLE